MKAPDERTAGYTDALKQLQLLLGERRKVKAVF